MEKLSEKIKRWQLSYEKYFKEFFEYAFGIIVIGICYALISLLFRWTSGCHWSFGLLACIIIIILICVGIKDQNKRIKKYDPSKPVWIIFTLMILLAALVSTEISFLLVNFNLAVYTPAENVSMDHLKDMYMYNFIDMIPVKIWPLLNVQAPLKANNLGARILMLAFLLFSLYQIVKSFKKWQEAIKELKNKNNK